MTKVKICGFTQVDEVKRCFDVDLLPDYAGFVFAESKRFLTLDKAKELALHIPDSVQRVGVFVNPTLQQIREHIALLDVIQLHGTESSEFIEEVCGLAEVQSAKKQVIKAIGVSAAADIAAYADCAADYLLLDNKRGGSGEKFDWQVLGNLQNKIKPYFIAGGLNAQNVSEALVYRPFGVDVSSLVESNGQKDKDKIQQFIRKVRDNNE